ncbi:MAG: ATPase, partial [Candidatus Hydrogenedentes bacterium]|nr:ATPase [Candidatus Hydrogenedentota bacterium]
MIRRRILPIILNALERQAAVAMIGPRQVGKTTLALHIAGATDSLYLDLEDPADREKLADPAFFLAQYD